MNRTIFIMIGIICMVIPAVHAAERADDATAKNKALIEAAKKGDLPEVRRLIAERVNINCTDDEDRTPLMHATVGGFVLIVSELLDAGANVDMQNEYGSTALMLASNKGFAPIVAALLAKKPDVNCTNKAGQTALAMAALYNRTPIITMLVAANADPHIKDNFGTTVFDKYQSVKNAVAEHITRSQEADYAEYLFTAASAHHHPLIRTLPPEMIHLMSTYIAAPGDPRFPSAQAPALPTTTTATTTTATTASEPVSEEE